MKSSQPPLRIALFQFASNVRQRHCIPRLSPRGAKKWHSFSHVLSETLHIPAHDHPHAAFDASLPCCWSIEQVWNVRREKISTYQSQTPLVLTSRSACFVEKNDKQRDGRFLPAVAFHRLPIDTHTNICLLKRANITKQRPEGDITNTHDQSRDWVQTAHFQQMVIIFVPSSIRLVD